MQIIKTDACILRSAPSGESNLVLTLLTKEYGKQSASLAKGRDNRKRYGTILEIFDIGIFELRLKNEQLASIIQYTPKKLSLALRTDLNALVLASVVCETIELLTPEAIVDPILYQLLTDFIGIVCQSHPTVPDLRLQLRSCHQTLKDLLNHVGFLDKESTLPPSSKSSLALITLVEQITGRQLQTRPALLETIQLIKNISCK